MQAKLTESHWTVDDSDDTESDRCSAAVETPTPDGCLARRPEHAGSYRPGNRRRRGYRNLRRAVAPVPVTGDGPSLFGERRDPPGMLRVACTLHRPRRRHLPRGSVQKSGGSSPVQTGKLPWSPRPLQMLSTWTCGRHMRCALPFTRQNKMSSHFSHDYSLTADYVDQRFAWLFSAGIGR